MFGITPLATPLALPKTARQLKLPLFSISVNAGPPTPASDHVEERIDLATLLVESPESTFLVRVTGESMVDASVAPGDILIVDRSIEPRNNDPVLAIVNGEFTLKTFVKHPTLHLAFQVWGVVVWVLHKTRP